MTLSPEGLTAFARRAPPQVRRVLAFLINGHREYAAPYDPLFRDDAAELIRDLWPRLRERGRVAIFIETDGSNVVNLIQWRAA